LELSKDKYGFRFLARGSPDDPDVVRLAAKLSVGVVKQASFAFIAKKNDYEFSEPEEDEEGPVEVHRRITEIQSLHDVCACPQGLFSQTISQLQTYAKLLGQPEQSGGRPRQSDLEGANVVTPEEEGDAVTPLEWPDLSADLNRFGTILRDP
jgi:hypothetical protein